MTRAAAEAVLTPLAGAESIEDALAQALRRVVALTGAAGGLLEFRPPRGAPLTAALGPRQRVLAVLEADATVAAEGLDVLRVAAEDTAFDHVLLGQQAGKGPDRGRLRGALLSTDQDAADGRVDGVEDQGELHALLTDDRCEGKRIAL